jgi:2-C-methyl-D-erythritol 2,4-cyclodiphosphate synthase
MHIDSLQISIKATTNEGIGFVGRKEGVSAYAVALIESL